MESIDYEKKFIDNLTLEGKQALFKRLKESIESDPSGSTEVSLETIYKDMPVSMNGYGQILNGIDNGFKIRFSCDSRANQSLAVIRCMAVADYVNEETHWKPLLSEQSYAFNADEGGGLTIELYAMNKSAFIHFKSEKVAEQAYKILGEETIREAMGLLTVNTMTTLPT